MDRSERTAHRIRQHFASAARRGMALILGMLLCFSVCFALAPAASAEEEEQTAETQNGTTAHSSFTRVDDSIAEDKWDLILSRPALFHRMTFTDKETGLYVHYNIFLPEDYDRAGAYPLVLFLPDIGSTGTNPELPLVQGIGGLVWTADAWQAEFPAIVAVPLYREAILDHVHGFTTTGYVDLTRNFVDHLCERYAVDSTRIYGTGQGMGCEALMAIAEEDPDVFTVCMFVSGQWNVEKLADLKDQKFIYFAAEDDRGVYRCAEQLMKRFAADGVEYTYASWNGGWTPYERTLAALKLTFSETGHYFILWKRGTIVPDHDDLEQAEGLTMVNPGVHVASFNAAFRCIAVLEWIFAQSDPPEYDLVK